MAFICAIMPHQSGYVKWSCPKHTIFLECLKRPFLLNSEPINFLPEKKTIVNIDYSMVDSIFVSSGWKSQLGQLNYCPILSCSNHMLYKRIISSINVQFPFCEWIFNVQTNKRALKPDEYTEHRNCFYRQNTPKN